MTPQEQINWLWIEIRPEDRHTGNPWYRRVMDLREGESMRIRLEVNRAIGFQGLSLTPGALAEFWHRLTAGL